MIAARTLNLTGNQATIKATSEETEGAFSMVEFVMGPNAIPAPTIGRPVRLAR